MTVTLMPGDMGIDISGLRLDTAKKVSDAKSAGCKFILRYSAGAGNSQPNAKWKLITPHEHAALLADGFDVIANSEWYESRITEGAQAGHADGAADLKLWKSCGHAKGASIYVSLDKAVPSNVNSIMDYLQAYEAALGGYYHADCYGGTPLLRKLIAAKRIHYGWRPNAGSWSNDGLPYQPNLSGANHKAMLARAILGTPAHLWQTGNYWFSKQADENMVLRTPLGSHWDAVRGATPVPVPPHPTPHPAPAPAHKPVLHRAWPKYMHSGNYFGLISGPKESHGGINTAERGDVKAIQQRLQALGIAPKSPAWADGKYEQPTQAAVAKWQHAHVPGTTRFGEVWSDDWAKLFTY